MNLLENFRIALDSLWSNRLRSFLALLGIVIGVFAVTAMVSLGQMLTAGVNKNLESVASRSVVVQPDFQKGVNFKRLKETDLESLSHLPVTLNPQIQVAAQYERPSKPGERRAMTVQGTLGDLREIDPSIRMAKGRYFTAIEGRAGQPLAVVNPAAVRELLGGRDPLGQTIRIYFADGRRAEVTVVGQTEPTSMLMGGDSPIIYTPVAFLWRECADTRRNEYDAVLLRVRDGYEIAEVAKQTKRIVENRYGQGVFMVESVESFQQTLNVITGGLSIGLGFIAGLSLLVGGIGIMNIMLVSVTERTREIGLRKALGATSGQIRTQFLIEATALTLVGGSTGVALAVAVLWVISLTVPFLSVFKLSPLTVVLALALSAVVGLFFGVWPAGRAAKLDPIESLRYE